MKDIREHYRRHLFLHLKIVTFGACAFIERYYIVANGD